MKNIRLKYILYLLTILLLLLWIPVTLDKFWDLQSFKQTLVRQPFPDEWAKILYWLLPTIEGICVLLFVLGTIDYPKTKIFLKWGFALSSLLLFTFTLFILFGVLGWYEQRPCGCGSVISFLNWEQHLWFNIVFLSLSCIGLWASSKKSGNSNGQDSFMVGRSSPNMHAHLFLLYQIKNIEYWRRSNKVKSIRWPRRFALFPGEAGTVSKLCTIAIRRKKC